MAKGSNQKLKIVYLIKILTEKTDEQHSITMNEIISELKAYGVNAERKVFIMILRICVNMDWIL